MTKSWRDYLTKAENKRVYEIDARQSELFAEDQLLTRERVFLQEKAALKQAREKYKGD